MQNAGGRGGSGPSAAASCRLVRDQAARCLRDGIGIDAFRPCLLKKCREPFEQHIGGVLAGHRQQPLAEQRVLMSRAAQFDVERLLDVVGMSFLDHQHGALARAERAISSGTSG